MKLKFHKGQGLIDVILVLAIIVFAGGILYFSFFSPAEKNPETAKTSEFAPSIKEPTKEPIKEEPKTEVQPTGPKLTEPKVTCQSECSLAGLKRCSGNAYQICGNYDTDNCLEWSSNTNCSPNTTCQNGVCVKEVVTTPPAIEPIIIALNKGYADKFPNWKQKADEFIDTINSVFVKNTLKQFKINKYLVYNDNEYTSLFTEPKKHSEYYQDVNNRGGITYISLVHKDNISSKEEWEQLYGSSVLDNVNVTRTVYKDNKIYSMILQEGSESRNVLLGNAISPSMAVHEMGHSLGLGVPDWYFYEYSDCTKVDPKFSDYSIKENPDFKNDPMSGGNLFNLNLLQFSESNSVIINKNLNLKYTYDYIRTNWFSKITKVYVTDKFGTPISGTIVKIFCARKGCYYCSTRCEGVTYGSGVPEGSSPEQTLVTDKNGYAIYNGPVGAWEMSESQNSPCLAKAIKVYQNGKSSVKVVNFIDLQRNYILNNTNEHITHIILE